MKLLKGMKVYSVLIDATTHISVEAESAEDAKQSALDVFSLRHVDFLTVQVESGD